MYVYLSSSAEKCRLPIGAGSTSGLANKGDPNLHMQLVHRIQASDAEDPWMQKEWGKVPPPTHPTLCICTSQS